MELSHGYNKQHNYLFTMHKEDFDPKTEENVLRVEGNLIGWMCTWKVFFLEAEPLLLKYF